MAFILKMYMHSLEWSSVSALLWIIVAVIDYTLSRAYPILSP